MCERRTLGAAYFSTANPANIKNYSASTEKSDLIKLADTARNERNLFKLAIFYQTILLFDRCTHNKHPKRVRSEKQTKNIFFVTDVCSPIGRNMKQRNWKALVTAIVP